MIPYIIIFVFLFILIAHCNKEEHIKVGIIDSGISDYQKDIVYKSKNFVEDESIFDTYNHGTIITNIINETSSKNTRLYMAKSINKNGKSQQSDFINAFNWLVKNDVDIINISQGMKYNSKEISQLIRLAEEKDIIVIASSGNNYLNDTDYPAKYPEVISIGTIDKNGNIHRYSGEGKIDYVALGVNIKVKDNSGNEKIFTGNSYATAYATGTIIDIYNIYKSNMENKIIIESHSYDPYHQKNLFGKGVITNEKLHN
ncbi:S8 family peptidase [Mammaliicoccus sp. Dog046]|uniref:S8 family peptidase n=1 Tax=Mammaliicoccus sp. Dog046 TaxID=3034233 RepID=UPI002B25EBDC|nr:S8 family serine peptidase [Mammaliicoccus sp. Dog046]WQK84399.1 S8 family serine peptidase [Mammaliicoccus sp. Dog046]